MFIIYHLSVEFWENITKVYSFQEMVVSNLCSLNCSKILFSLILTKFIVIYNKIYTLNSIILYQSQIWPFVVYHTSQLFASQ